MDYQTIVTNVKNGVIQTPAYIFDIDILREKVAGICEILGGTAQMCYAIKANPFLLNAMDDMVDKYEVCSPGELEICRNCRIPMEKRSAIQQIIAIYKYKYLVRSKDIIIFLSACANHTYSLFYYKKNKS